MVVIIKWLLMIVSHICYTTCFLTETDPAVKLSRVKLRRLLTVCEWWATQDDHEPPDAAGGHHPGSSPLKKKNLTPSQVEWYKSPLAEALDSLLKASESKSPLPFSLKTTTTTTTKTNVVLIRRPPQVCTRRAAVILACPMARSSQRGAPAQLDESDSRSGTEETDVPRQVHSDPSSAHFPYTHHHHHTNTPQK